MYWSPDASASASATPNPHQHQQRGTIACLVPVFNEEVKSLQRTLTSLHAQAVELAERGFRFHVLLVLDGWSQASDSMRHYMQVLFPDERGSAVPWCELIQPFDIDVEMEAGAGPHNDNNANANVNNPDNANNLGNLNLNPNPNPNNSNNHTVGTLALQRVDNAGAVVPTCIGWFKGKAMWMKISLLVKKDNRRRINSHHWFLNCFAPFYRANFVLLTECGAAFSKGCLLRLTQHLVANPACVACTGRQRVMSKTVAGVDEEGVIDSMWRRAQFFDFESSQSMMTATFSLCGMLPALPSACGLYRFARIYDYRARDVRMQSLRQLEEQGVPAPFRDHDEPVDAVDYYCKLSTQNPDESGLLEGSLLLSEDRILSFASVLKPARAGNEEETQTQLNCCALDVPYTEYLPDTVFYVEAETQPKRLLQQRRRWINSSISSFWWLLFSKPQLISQSPLRFFLQTNAVRFLLACQLLVSLLTVLSPAMFGVAFHVAVKYTFANVDALNSIEPYSAWFLFGYMALYILFALRHSVSRLPKLSYPLYHATLLLNMLVSVWLVGALVLSIVLDGFSALHYVVAAQLVVPFVLNLHASSAPLRMLWSSLSYYLLLPTMIGSFATYAASRTWELTWGNRSSDKLSSMVSSKSPEQVDAVQLRLRLQSKLIAALAVAFNVIFSFTFALTSIRHELRDWYFFLFALCSGLWMCCWAVFLVKFWVLKFVDSLLACLDYVLCARCLRRKTAPPQDHNQEFVA